MPSHGGLVGSEAIPEKLTCKYPTARGSSGGIIIHFVFFKCVDSSSGMIRVDCIWRFAE